MFQAARQFRVPPRQSLHRHADASVVQRSRPRRGFGDVTEGILRVENHTNRFRRRKVQLGFNGRKMPLQGSQYFPRQRWRGCAAVAQFEVTALVFLVAFFLLLIRECSVQR